MSNTTNLNIFTRVRKSLVKYKKLNWIALVPADQLFVRDIEDLTLGGQGRLFLRELYRVAKNGRLVLLQRHQTTLLQDLEVLMGNTSHFTLSEDERILIRGAKKSFSVANTTNNVEEEYNHSRAVEVEEIEPAEKEENESYLQNTGQSETEKTKTNPFYNIFGSAFGGNKGDGLPDINELETGYFRSNKLLIVRSEPSLESSEIGNVQSNWVIHVEEIVDLGDRKRGKIGGCAYDNSLIGGWITICNIKSNEWWTTPCSAEDAKIEEGRLFDAPELDDMLTNTVPIKERPINSSLKKLANIVIEDDYIQDSNSQGEEDNSSQSSGGHDDGEEINLEEKLMNPQSPMLDGKASEIRNELYNIEEEVKLLKQQINYIERLEINESTQSFVGRFNIMGTGASLETSETQV